jgi:hypothetical protein
MEASVPLLALLGVLVAIFPVFGGELEAEGGQHIHGHEDGRERHTDPYGSNQVRPPSTEPSPFSIGQE